MLVVILLLIGIPIYFCAWLINEHPIIAVGVVGLVGGAILRGILAARERRRALISYYTSMIANAKAIVSTYGAELAIRRKQLTITLSYGVVDDSKWCEEIEFFIDNVIVPAGYDIRSSPPCLEVVRRAITSATNHFAASRLCYAPDMDPTDYEVMVADALTDLGWQTRLTKGSGDQGIDVIAEKSRKSVVVQCKRYASAIGNSAVQEAHAGKSFEGAEYAAVVSNAAFTRGARQLAKSTGVILLHHDELAQLETKIFTADAMPTSACERA